MTHSKPDLDQLLLEDFIKDLEVTTQQVQSLLRDIRESEVEFAATKMELKIFVEHVKELSSLIREGHNGNSLLTRVALVEKSIEAIEGALKSNNQRKESQMASLHSIQVAEKTGRWQLLTAIAAGVLALITSTITLLISLLGKH